jgi:hypothetical protein
MRRGALALAAGIALADASIVTLGLPSILVELEATVEGVALVLGVYTAILALALLPASALAGRIGPARLGAAGIGLFAAASLGCGLSGSLEMLIAFRAAQARRFRSWRPSPPRRPISPRPTPWPSSACPPTTRAPARPSRRWPPATPTTR